MSVFGDNVARLRVSRNLTQRDLGNALGVSHSTVASWEARGSMPNMPTMDRLAEYFNVSVAQLFTPEVFTADDFGDFSSRDLRVYGRIAAGTPLDMDEADGRFPCPTYLLDRHPRAFYLRVEGDSMSRVLPDGCFVLVDPSLADPVISGLPYAVCVNGHAATVKRVRLLANGIELDPDSLDPTYHPQVFDSSVDDTQTITIIGRVVWYAVPFNFKI